MTSAATKAREIAQHCEAKKHALRQTQDGIVVAFVLHPSDVPAALQLAPLGTRYMLALVEIGDDETPIARKEAQSQVSNIPPTPASTPDTAPMRARRPVASEKRFAQQAGICCGDPVFQAFLYEHDMVIEKSEDCAVTAVYLICGVASRKDIVPGSAAATAWDQLYSKYTAWKLAA